jgi:hypothetical protein
MAEKSGAADGTSGRPAGFETAFIAILQGETQIAVLIGE